MSNGQSNLLVSIDFRQGKGGISRVARLISKAVDFNQILSLNGKSFHEAGVRYFNNRRTFLTFWIIRYILRHRPELIVFDHLNVARLLLLVPKPLLKKVVIFLHDEEAWGKVTGLRHSALLKASHILCNSEFTLQKFIQHNPDFRHKTKVCLPGGVPLQFKGLVNESTISNSWFNDSRPYLLFVSRLWKAHRYKGYIELLNAFSMYYSHAQKPYVRLAIVGGGDDEDEVTRLIAEKNLSDHVGFFTHVQDEELALFYKNSLAFVFPSTREGFGMVYLEAMYFKKACVGIKDQPAEEIIVNDQTGKLLPDQSPETIKAIIEDIAQFPDKYIQYGEKGYMRYQEYFTEEHFKNRFINCIL